MSEEKPAFWTSLPGILTGLAAIITASVGLYLAIKPTPPPPITDNRSGTTGPSITSQATVQFDQWPIWKEETFKDNANGWTLGNFQEGGLKHAELKLLDGKYRWDVETLDSRFFTCETPFGSLDNFYVSVNLRFLDTTLQCTYAGIKFGLSTGSAFMFVVSPRQAFSLWKYTEGGANSTSILGWTHVPIDLHSSIHLGVLVDNQKFTLFINSKLASSFTDPSFTGGKMTLYVGTDQAAAFVVDFDDFTIRQKPPI